MEKKRFEEEMSKKSKILGVRFSVEQIDQFYKYMNLLIEWNEKMNLTAITEPKEIILKHFIDSITILKYIDDNSKLVDVGTGAGFPGVPLSIMNPTLKITLVDSLNKRLIFLQEVVKELNLKNIEIVHARAEEFGQNKNYREKFDIATSRAVANLATLSEYLVPLVKIGGKIISMKASNAKEEINDAQKAIEVLGGKIEKIEEMGYGNLPICIAKTQYSLSDDAKNLECDEPFEINVRDVELKAGAGFIVVLAGKIMTMPGLPKIPAAESIDIDENRKITGIF